MTLILDTFNLEVRSERKMRHFRRVLLGLGGSIVFVWVIGCYLFFLDARKEAVVRLKLQPSDGNTEHVFALDFISPFKKPKAHRRELSKGIIEVPSVQTNVRRVRPPLFVRDRRERAQPLKREKNAMKTKNYHHASMNSFRNNKRSKKVRSVVFGKEAEGYRAIQFPANQQRDKMRYRRRGRDLLQLFASNDDGEHESKTLSLRDTYNNQLNSQTLSKEIADKVQFDKYVSPDIHLTYEKGHENKHTSFHVTNTSNNTNKGKIEDPNEDNQYVPENIDTNKVVKNSVKEEHPNYKQGSDSTEKKRNENLFLGSSMINTEQESIAGKINVVDAANNRDQASSAGHDEFSDNPDHSIIKIQVPEDETDPSTSQRQITEDNPDPSVNKIQAPEDDTDPSVNKIQAPEDDTDPSVNKIQAPEDDTDPSVNKIQAPEDDTDPSVNKIQAPEDNPDPSVNKIQAAKDDTDHSVNKIQAAKDDTDPSVNKRQTPKYNPDQSVNKRQAPVDDTDNPNHSTSKRQAPEGRTGLFTSIRQAPVDDTDNPNHPTSIRQAPVDDTDNPNHPTSKRQTPVDDTDNTGHSISKRQAPEYTDNDKPEDIDQALPQLLSERVRSAVVRSLTEAPHFSQSRALGDSVDLSCQNDAMKVIKEDMPGVNVHWMLNGQPLATKFHRMQQLGADLKITDLTPADTGVYECRVAVGQKHKVTLGVFALTVITNAPTECIREIEPFLMDSHSFPLARALWMVDLSKATQTDLGFCRAPCMTTSLSHNSTVRQWFLNGSRSALFPEEILANLRTKEKIDAVRPDMAGEWWCEVTHRPSGKVWKTSWYHLFVKDPPSDLEQWWWSALQRPWLLSSVGVLLLGSCMGASVLVARFSQKQHENLEEKWQKTKARLMKRQSFLDASEVKKTPQKKKRRTLANLKPVEEETPSSNEAGSPDTSQLKQRFSRILSMRPPRTRMLSMQAPSRTRTLSMQQAPPRSNRLLSMQSLQSQSDRASSFRPQPRTERVSSIQM